MNDLVIEFITEKKVRITYPDGKVRDKRTGRLYAEVICAPSKIKSFEGTNEEE